MAIKDPNDVNKTGEASSVKFENLSEENQKKLVEALAAKNSPSASPANPQSQNLSQNQQGGHQQG